MYYNDSISFNWIVLGLAHAVRYSSIEVCIQRNTK